MCKVTAEEMVRSIKAFAKLDGFRGAPKRDVNTVIDVILRMDYRAGGHALVLQWTLFHAKMDSESFGGRTSKHQSRRKNRQK